MGDLCSFNEHKINYKKQLLFVNNNTQETLYTRIPINNIQNHECVASYNGQMGDAPSWDKGCAIEGSDGLVHPDARDLVDSFKKAVGSRQQARQGG